MNLCQGILRAAYHQANCLVHSNASGYMDKDGFKAYAENFVRHCGANASNYVFLFIDAHESHFDAEAQLYLEEHHAQVILLRSNNSTEDQPLDMGPNSHIDAIHKDEGSKWRDQRPGLPLTIQSYNDIFAATSLGQIFQRS